ncbi:protein Red-like [Lineus longissimus]|uniref:protein Red-like n=1 Tax=Lineus longissimus TaxID=88925 RepID=UPI002B4D863F
MPERGADTEVFSNPLPPSDLVHNTSAEDQDDLHPLTNDDFRKLMMTPRVPGMGSGAAASATASATAGSTSATPAAPAARIVTKPTGSTEPEEEDDAATRRRKKKSYYAKLKKLEEEREKELAAKYRDRARERRDGNNKDYEQPEMISTTADYRAVAPDAKSGEGLAERRKQLIQESKYLGGDMEHTHLVKGLDFALLEKVRAEITSKETFDVEVEETIKKKEKEEVPEEQVEFRTKMARNIFRTIFKTKAPERNELFLPRRMAYVVDLEDDYGDSEIPTTLIRSKADCPSLESTTTLTTNDIVINKLTQILSYLRQGRRDRKRAKKDKGKKEDERKEKLAGHDDLIYGDIGDYIPSYGREKDRKKDDRDRERDRRDRDRDQGRDRRDYRDRDRDRHRGRDRDRERDQDFGRERGRRDRDRERDMDRRERKNYFEKPIDEDDVRDKGAQSAKDLVKSINEKFSKGWAPADMEREAQFKEEDAEKKPKPEKERLKKLQKKMVIDSYAECYPGMMESADAIGDSDDEVDYTKMDMGNKKGPVGRWDFDTQEEYSDYMSNKEALPKAAFQYGVKMADGRKTRRAGPKDEKAELDREWQKIQNIIQKRKHTGTTGGPSSTKYPKY